MREYQTPCYVIKEQKLQDNCEVIENSFREQWGDNIIFAYSVKTNHHDLILKIMKKRGWTAEVVSMDEYRYIKSLGYDKPVTICNGPIKGDMLGQAWKENHIINLDNMQEVEQLCNIVDQDGILSEAKVGIRINYDFEKKCPKQKEIGNEDSRFGICYESGEVEKAIGMLHEKKISVCGLHMHTSTKTRSIPVFKELSYTAGKIATEFQLPIQYIDIGGGFFGGQILYGKPRMEEYARVIGDELKNFFDPQKVVLILEPGAAVVATAIEYVTKVRNIRNIRGKHIVTLDGTLLHINPFMVNREPNLSILPSGNVEIHKQVLCGCTCMEKDIFYILENEKELKVGDTIIFNNAGAYTMSFNSNFIVNPPQVYLEEVTIDE